MLRAQELKLAIPDELAIVGYAGLDIAEAIRPRVSTVRIPKYSIGEHATRLLIDQMAGRSDPASADLSFELVRARRREGPACA